MTKMTDFQIKMMKKKMKKLEEELKQYKEMFDRLPNDMDDKWWCEKNRRWRWDGDGFEEESESEEEDEEPNCCEFCGKNFDLNYVMNKADKDLRAKYDKYMGSPDDDGDICPECLEGLQKEEDLEAKIDKLTAKIVIRPEDSLDHLIGKCP